MSDKWQNIGNIVSKLDDDGNIIGYFFAFHDDVKSVAINGKELDLEASRYLNVQSPVDKWKRLVEYEKMKEEEFAEKKAAFDSNKIRTRLELSRAPNKK